MHWYSEFGIVLSAALCIFLEWSEEAMPHGSVESILEVDLWTEREQYAPLIWTADAKMCSGAHISTRTRCRVHVLLYFVHAQ